ncbi:MAG: sulfatase-like hydrolase/transferase [Bryobacterales bacterium]|nr:sulfatase-like hydrolase/transferase [Bryobacterales bacterium]
MLTRRDWLAAGASSLTAQAAQNTSRTTRRQPNFLFLIADDHAGYVLGADGNRQAVTPHLDRLAAEGTRFASHYCNSPVCTPSRQSFFTGQMPSMAGVTRLPTPLSDQKPTIAKQLKQAGYRTGVIGKMHFNRPAAPGLHGFDYMITERELAQDWNKLVKPAPIPAGIATKPQWRPFRDPARIWLNADKLAFPRYEQDMKAGHQVKLAEQFMEQNRDQPFALWVSFHEPHSPFDFPVEYRSKVDAKAFRPPRVGPEDAWQIPKIFRDLTEEDKQGIIAAYYTSVNYLDQNIGRVLDKLQHLDLDGNTLIVYTADHGYDLGHHGRFEKHCGYDPALRVPLIMRYPGKIRKGAVQHFTEHVDLAPTVLDLLGAAPLPIQHGHSLRPYLENRRIEARSHIFSQYLENEEAFVRTDKWKLICCSGKRARGDGYDIDNPTPGRYQRLYDLKADPGEFVDVAAKYPKVAYELQTLMLDRFRQTHPEAGSEPANSDREAILDWYLRPRDV